MYRPEPTAEPPLTLSFAALRPFGDIGADSDGCRRVGVPCHRQVVPRDVVAHAQLNGLREVVNVRLPGQEERVI